MAEHVVYDRVFRYLERQANSSSKTKDISWMVQLYHRDVYVLVVRLDSSESCRLFRLCAVGRCNPRRADPGVMQRKQYVRHAIEQLLL